MSNLIKAKKMKENTISISHMITPTTSNDATKTYGIFWNMWKTNLFALDTMRRKLNTFINHALDQLFLSANVNPIAKKRIQSRKKRKHNLGTELETRNRSDRCTKISRILDEEKRK